MEKISEKNGVEVETVETDDPSISSIEEPFDPKKIDITTKQMILEAIFRRLRDDAIDLKTFFQRGMDLWGKDKQSRLIESILIRLPLPAFYFDGSDDDNWLVVDGLQRLSTFQNFVIDKSFKLRGLEYLTQFNGRGFNGLPRGLRRRIEEHEITAYIINPGTPDEVKFNLYRRINTGGLVLQPQEIRHAINHGIPAEFIKSLAELNEFKKYGISPKRMMDRDFVTRFVAFYIHEINAYKPDLDTFLNASMAKLRKLPVKERSRLKNDFKKSLIAAWKIFGKDAFRKRYKSGDKRKPINKALFEAWTVNLAKLHNDEIQRIVSRKRDVKKEFIKLMNDEDFEKSITSGTGKKYWIEIRFRRIRGLIAKVVR